ncbi:MAG: hypothetical protein V1897_08460 [Pseudomonadota bacterium]
MELLDLHEALLPFFSVLAIGFLICRTLIGLNLGPSAGIACLKAAIPTIYFVWFFDGTWTIADDLMYYYDSSSVAGLSYNPLDPTVLMDTITTVRMVAGSFHWLYYLWNVLAIRLFGDHYASPVFLNVALTFVGGWSLGRMASIAGFDQKYCKGLATFFLLHWEVLAWSSFLNIKDSLVMVMEIIFMASMMSVLLGKNIRDNLICVILTLSGLAITRFYVVILFAANWFMSNMILTRKMTKFFLFLALCLAGILFAQTYFPLVFSRLAIEDGIAKDVDTGNPIYQAIRFMIWPKPGVYFYEIDEGSGFATISHILHHIFFPFFVISFLRLSYRNKFFLPVAVFFFQVVFLYSIVPGNLGPRQRYQICWIFAWCQFDYIYTWWHTKQPQKKFVR